MSSLVSARIQKLIKKTSDIDKDERFMATSDLCNELANLEEAQARTATAATPGAPAPASSGASSASVLDSSLHLSLAKTLLTLLEDQSTDVQTVSVKCLAILCRRINSDQLWNIVDKLCALICDPSKTESRDIYAIGMKTMIQSVAGVAINLSRTASATSTEPSVLGAAMAQRILNGMIAGLKNVPSEPSSGVELDILSTQLEIVREVLLKFGVQVAESHEPLLAVITPRLESSNDIIRKRTLSTLSSLVPFLADRPFQSFVELIISMLARHETLALSATDPKIKKTENNLLYSYLQMIGIVSTTEGARIGKYLTKIVPQLEKFLTLPSNATGGTPHSTAASADEAQVIELWENSLSAFESLIQRCPNDFVPFLPRILKLAQQFIQYDPNYIYAPEEQAQEDVDMDDAAADKAPKKSSSGDDDDWGEGDGGDDGWGAGADEEDDAGFDADEDGSDDLSWKVRRAAVKLLAAYIRTRSTLQVDQQGNSQHLCGLLLERFKERDQSVKLALIQAVQELVRENANNQNTSQQQASSTVFVAQIPAIVTSAIKQLKLNANSNSASGSASTATAFAETKHYIFLLLIELVYASRGGLDAYLSKLLPLIVQNLTASSGKVELKLDAIHLLRGLIDLHPPKVWFDNNAEASQQIHSIVQALVHSLQDTPYSKYKTEVLLTTNSLLILLGNFKQQQVKQPHPQYQSIISSAILSSVYQQLVYSTLLLNDVELELKECVLSCLGTFFYYFGFELQQIGQGQYLDQCLTIVLQQRLTNELTRVASLRCLTRLTQSSEKLDVFRLVFRASLPNGGGRKVLEEELISFLKKDSQLLKQETIQLLIGLMINIETLATAEQKSQLLTQPACSLLLKELSQHLSDTDLNLSNSILILFNKLLCVLPQLSVYNNSPQAVADADVILGKVLQFIRSPLLQQQNVTSVVQLFAGIMKLTQADVSPSTINSHYTFPYLFDLFMQQLTILTAGAGNGVQSSSSVATASSTSSSSSSSIPSSIVLLSQIVGSGLLLHIPSADQSQVIQKLLVLIQSPSSPAASDSSKQFALLILGELGRTVHLTPLNPNLNENIFFQCMASDNEHIRAASSVAFGSVLLGNIAYYLPTLLKQMQQAQASNKKETLLLLLNSLKECIGHLTVGASTSSSFATASSAFRSFIPSLLPLLWSHAEHSEENIRSIVSEVLGGILIIDSAATFPELVRLISSNAANTRSVVITALRHSLTLQQHMSSSTQGNATVSLSPTLLAQHLPTFLQMLQDSDLTVRRQAILTVNALAHSKAFAPQLLPALPTILPLLYQHLIPDPKLVRVVDLGPFKHKIDDGFPLRKASYQTLDTLFDVSFSQLDAVTLIRQISAGLTDHDDITILVYQMLEKCAVRHPIELSRVLDEMPAKMMEGVKEKLKLAKTVPADATAASSAAPSAAGAGGDASTAERAKDVLRAAVRAFYAIQSMPTVNQCPQFVEFYQRVLKTAMLAKMLEEMLSK